MWYIFSRVIGRKNRMDQYRGDHTYRENAPQFIDIGHMDSQQKFLFYALETETYLPSKMLGRPILIWTAVKV